MEITPCVEIRICLQNILLSSTHSNNTRIQLFRVLIYDMDECQCKSKNANRTKGQSFTIMIITDFSIVTISV